MPHHARWDQPVLVVMAGLPATGKTTLSRALANAIDAVHLRIDTVEQAVRDFDLQADGPSLDAPGEALATAVARGLGYDVAQAQAREFLRHGNHVVADAVNPVAIARAGWRDVAATTGVGLVEVEVICSDLDDHRRRATTRTADLPGLVDPTWDDITARDYEPWDRPRVVVDTAGVSVDAAVADLFDLLGVAPSRRPSPTAPSSERVDHGPSTS